MSHLTEYHSHFDGGREWRLTPSGVELKAGIPRTAGEPVTAANVWSSHSQSINGWSLHYGVPTALVLATICTESHGDETAVREESKYLSDEQTPNQISAGLMQTLLSTARSMVPSESIDRSWLMIPDNSIRAGTAYIASQSLSTGYDPPLVAAAYNAGSIRRHDATEWLLKAHGDHLDRFTRWFNDGVAVLQASTMAPEVPTDAQVQHSWRLCSSCFGLYFDGGADAGLCPSEGAHMGSELQFVVPHQALLAHAQTGWRWCSKCQGLFHGSGACVAGGSHTDGGSGEYSVIGGVNPPPGYYTFRWCDRCNLAFCPVDEERGPDGGGSCPAGGGHSATTTSGWYAIASEEN